MSASRIDYFISFYLYVKGRISRGDYVEFFLLPAIAGGSVVTIVCFFLRVSSESMHNGELIALPFMCWVFLAVYVKRLHDIGHSGWWVLAVFALIFFVPLASVIVPIVLAFIPGQASENRHGANTNQVDETSSN
jgi:uncharacterized membrane protein YhaH (DUF805 family)